MSRQVSAPIHSLPVATQVTRSPRKEGWQARSQVKAPPSSVDAGRAIQVYFQAKMRGPDPGEGQPLVTHGEAGVSSSILSGCSLQRLRPLVASNTAQIFPIRLKAGSAPRGQERGGRRVTSKGWGLRGCQVPVHHASSYT